MNTTGDWFLWALLAAVFAAMTSIFAKVGGIRCQASGEPRWFRKCTPV
ncbi:MAG: hypothetical protein ACKVYV_19040 [Limisphaerales bacterium]